MIGIKDWNEEWKNFIKKKRIKYLIGLSYPAFHFINHLTLKKVNYYQIEQIIGGYIFVPPAKLDVFELYIEYEGKEYRLNKLERIIMYNGSGYTNWVFNGVHESATSYKGTMFEEQFDLTKEEANKIEALFLEFHFEKKIKNLVVTQHLSGGMKNE